MKADLSRRTHQPAKHYARLLHQQGRVPLDADLNEAFEIEDGLRHAGAIDVIGPVGVPKGDSFLVEPAPGGKDITVRPGALYVDGVRAESESTSVPGIAAGANVLQLAALTVDGRALAPGEWIELSSASVTKVYRLRGADAAQRRVTLGPADNIAADFPGTPTLALRRRPSFIHQPDWPRPAATNWPAPSNPGQLTEAELPAIAASLANGAYQVYLDVWSRHITAIEDPSIREVALGGPDTCTRVKTVWQVRLRRLGDVGTVGCDLQPDPWGGTLSARAKLPSTGDNPCVLAPGSSYRRLENQLYRVEIHGAGSVTSGVATAGLTFKFSRDNGAVVARWLGATATDLSVESLGRDSTLGLGAGQWVELIDDQRELSGEPGTLVQIESVVGTTLTMKSGTATGTTAFADFAGNPRVRRWDVTAGAIAMAAGWLDLEDGVQIQFGDGDYPTGAYWTIPARTITADVEWPLDPDGQPIARPAEGIVHHRAPLGVMNWDGAVFTPSVAPDCRTQFPPLTHICADDVCLHGDPCGLGATTVQEALEKLCEQQDMPFHNQHLHGWGVVCGLQVKCLRLDSPEPDPRTKVTIETGYALHPTGTDIKVAQAITYPVLDEMKAQGLAGQSAVSLWIDRDRSLHLEAYDPNHKKTTAELLEGTILIDIWNECLQPVFDFFKKELTVPDGMADDLVSPAQKRITTLINLIWQFVNKQSGRGVYLSGEVADAAEGPNHEDKILRDLFAGLRLLLQSETFCAMFDDIVFPEYDVYKKGFEDPKVAHPFTIFGKALHNRLRVHPEQPFGFTMGNGPLIDVFDLKQGKLVTEVTFPVTGADVQDVAFNPKTSQIYAVAWIGDAKTDSAVVRGDIQANGQIVWTQNQVTCSKKVVTLQSGAFPQNKLFAAARGSGIFMFDMNALDPNPPQIGAEARVTGHLVLSERGTVGSVLYYGAHSSNTNPVAYDRIERIQLSPTGAAAAAQVYILPVTSTLNGEGHDDIAVLYDPSNPNAAVSRLFVVAEGAAGGGKALLVFDGATPGSPTMVALGQNTENRLAYNARTREVFITFEDSSQGRQFGALDAAPQLHNEVQPLQIGPISVAVGDGGRQWYVLNWISRTITAIPAEHVAPALSAWDTVIDVDKLGIYRDAVIVAFLKLIGRFLQYLKDCVCEHLLLDCPDPNGKKVYLADISVKDGAVYQICNFSHRRYVHTFPGVEYWMSFVPVIPMLKQGVEKFCCSVLTGFFDKLKAPAPDKGDTIKPGTVRGGFAAVKDLNLKATFNAQKSQVALASSLGKTMLLERLARPPAGTPAQSTAGVAKVDLIGRPAADATAATDARGVTVDKVVVADAATTAKTLAANALAPARIAPGTRVDLLTDSSGRVIGFRPAEVASAPAANLPTANLPTANLPTANVPAGAVLTAPSGIVRKAAVAAPAAETPVAASSPTSDATATAAAADLARLRQELADLRTELAGLKDLVATSTSKRK